MIKQRPMRLLVVGPEISLAALAFDVIAGVAARVSCTIVGRRDQCLLHSYSEALHVLVYAPLVEPVARLQLVLLKWEALLRRLPSSKPSLGDSSIGP